MVLTVYKLYIHYYVIVVSKSYFKRNNTHLDNIAQKE
jgi:hypothetical protein